MSNYHQNKFQRVQSNTNATIENRSAGAANVNGRSGAPGYGNGEKAATAQGQKL